MDRILFNGYRFTEIHGFYYLLIFCTLYVNAFTVSPANKNHMVSKKTPQNKKNPQQDNIWKI